MSNVTDLILITCIAEETYPNNDRPVKRLYDYIKQHHDRRFRRVDEHAGGDKGFQAAVHMCAINYLHLQNFLDLFHEGDWTFREHTMLLYKLEHDDQFTVVVPKEIQIQVNDG